MSILDNAIDALECGLQDFQTGTPARLKSSIRNIHSGILLLFKEKLSQLSPPDSDEALIKQKVVPSIVNGQLIWLGDGKKTVDVQSIKERFESLGISVDWTYLNSVGNIRNDVEHYFSTANNKAIQEAIAKSFLIVRDFMLNQLGVDPQSKLSTESWSVFLSAKDIYLAERADCVATFTRLETDSEVVGDAVKDATCEGCGSDLLYFAEDGTMQCRACGKTLPREAAICHVIDETLGFTAHRAAMDGASPPYTECPECGENALIISEMQCAACGEAQNSECDMCGNEIPVEEIDGSGTCGYCTHKMSKDD
jgi:hypothetical protein